MAAAVQWDPMTHLMSADFFGMALRGRLDDPATAREKPAPPRSLGPGACR